LAKGGALFNMKSPLPMSQIEEVCQQWQAPEVVLMGRT